MKESGLKKNYGSGESTTTETVERSVVAREEGSGEKGEGEINGCAQGIFRMVKPHCVVL